MASSSIGSSLPATRPVREVKIAEPRKTISKRLDPVAQQQKRKYCAGPYVLDYIPLASTIKNFIDLVLKIFWRPSQPNLLSPKAKAYYEHITQKSFFKCIIGMVPVLGNIVLVFAHENKKANDANLIRSIEGGNESAFKQIYFKGTSDQKEQAVEGAYKASFHKVWGNAKEGQNSLLLLLQKGEKQHKEKVISALLSDIHEWDLQSQENWLKNEDVPQELRNKILTISVNELLKTGKNPCYLFMVANGEQRSKIIEAYCEAADLGNKAAAGHILSFYAQSEASEHRTKINNHYCKHAENPKSSYYSEAWDFLNEIAYHEDGWKDAQNAVYGLVSSHLKTPIADNENRLWPFLIKKVRFSFEMEKQLIQLAIQRLLSHPDRNRIDPAFSYLISRTSIKNDKQLQVYAFSGIRAIANAGYREAQYFLGKECLERDNLNMAIKWFGMASSKGHIDSMFYLGILFYSAKRSMLQAFYWIEKAAKLNHLNSMVFLGNYYATFDVNKALYWYSKAASLGNSFAQRQCDAIQRRRAFQNQAYDRNAQAERDRKNFEEFLSFIFGFESNRSSFPQQGAFRFGTTSGTFSFGQASGNSSRTFPQQGAYRSGQASGRGSRTYNRQNLHPFTNPRDEASRSLSGIENLLGRRLPSSITVSAFKAEIRKWMLANHPDKNNAANAKANFQKMNELVEKFKTAKKMSGEAGWDYK